MSDLCGPGHQVEDDDDLTEDEEDDDVDLEVLHAKFSGITAALQETNQNLVTFELLQDHYRNVSKAGQTPNTSLPVQPAPDGQDVDIVDLLRDICGSVNELKTEMGNSGMAGKINLEEIEKKLKYPQKFVELTEKSSKIEVECGFYKNQCQNIEDKYMEEKRKNAHLEDLIRSREDEIRKLNSYLKEAEEFSKNIEEENRFLQKQVSETKSQLKQELDSKVQLKSELDVLKLAKDNEDCKINKAAQTVKITEDVIKPVQEDDGGSDLEMEMDIGAAGQSARSTLSSRSAEGGYEEKYKEVKEAKNRLKQKTKLLLRQYRGKRSQLEKKDRQLAGQRSGLLKLQTLHQSVEANHCVVIHHLGHQIRQTANLVSTLWPGDDLSVLDGSEAGSKLSEWIIRIDSLSAWTISKLVKVSLHKRRSKEVSGPADSSAAERKSLRAAAMKCELGIEDEGRAVKSLISGLQEEEEDTDRQQIGEDTDRQVGTWM